MDSFRPYPIHQMETTIQEVKRVLSLMRDNDDPSTISNHIKNFMNSERAGKIQNQFEQACGGEDNWATNGFLQTLLSVRTSLPYSTMFASMMVKDDSNCSQAMRAASLLFASATIYKSPNQSSNILGTCRLPGETMDSLDKWDGKDHAVVLFRGAAYRVMLFDRDGNHVPKEIILHSIKSILNSEDDQDLSVSGFTSLDRPTWHQIRQGLKKRSNSCAAQEEIESSIVVLALDNNDSPNNLADQLKTITFSEQLGQRYYDKTINIVVFADGEAGCLFEHTATDGYTAAFFLETIHSIARDIKFDRSISNGVNESLKPINFFLTEEEKEMLPKQTKAEEDRHYMSFTIPIPEDALKLMCEEKVTGTWIILSAMLALKTQYDHMNHLLVQPCQVQHFKEGRSDPIFPITDVAMKLISEMSTKSVLAEQEKIQLFAEALSEQKKLVKKAKEGCAFGPHIAFIRQLLTTANHSEDKEMLKLLSVFRTPSVVVTGSNQTNFSAHRGFIGNAYLKDQMIVNYSILNHQLTFNIITKGYFSHQLDSFKKIFTPSLLNMMQLAVPFALAQEMAIPMANPSFKSPEQNDSKKKFLIALHVGASSADEVNPEVKHLMEFGMQMALNSGAKILASNGTSLDAVEMVTKALEDCFLFNAGKGAVCNEAGKHELDACIMDGSSKSSGAVACVKTVKNPISAARLVLSNSPHKLITGIAAESFAEKNGLSIVENETFNTVFREKKFKDYLESKSSKTTKHPQTVGVVALDVHGNMSASSSTGGAMGKMEGRVGDSALLGAGLYANDQCSVTCSGHGEVFIEKTVAYSVANLVEKGIPLEDACKRIVADLPDRSGGILALDKAGNVVCTYNSNIMLWASTDNTNEAKIHMSPKSEEKQLNHTTSKSSKDKLPIWEDETMFSYVDPTPFLPGTVVVTYKHQCPIKLVDLDDLQYAKLISASRKVAYQICQTTGVKRCAMVVDSKSRGFVHALVIPIDGLDDTYKPVLSDLKEFSEVIVLSLNYFCCQSFE